MYQQKAHIDKMLHMVRKYSTDFPQVELSATMTLPAKKTVFMTGSTGSLGTHTLDRLIDAPDVERVIAFTRTKDGVDGRKRLAAALALRGLDASRLESPKVKVVSGDLFAPKFGLGDSEYKDVSSSRDDPTHGDSACHRSGTMSRT